MSIPSTVVMNMYLLSSFYAPGTIEDTGDAAENKIDKKKPFLLTLQWGK